MSTEALGEAAIQETLEKPLGKLCPMHRPHAQHENEIQGPRGCFSLEAEPATAAGSIVQAGQGSADQE